MGKSDDKTAISHPHHKPAQQTCRGRYSGQKRTKRNFLVEMQNVVS